MKKNLGKYLYYVYNQEESEIISKYGILSHNTIGEFTETGESLPYEHQIQILKIDDKNLLSKKSSFIRENSILRFPSIIISNLKPEILVRKDIQCDFPGAESFVIYRNYDVCVDCLEFTIPPELLEFYDNGKWKKVPVSNPMKPKLKRNIIQSMKSNIRKKYLNLNLNPLNEIERDALYTLEIFGKTHSINKLVEKGFDLARAKHLHRTYFYGGI